MVLVGIDVMLDWWSHRLRSCTPYSLWYMFMPSIPIDLRLTTCMSAQCTRSQTEQIWPTSSHYYWRPAKTQITGSWEEWLCSVISSRPIAWFSSSNPLTLKNFIYQAVFLTILCTVWGWKLNTEIFLITVYYVTVCSYYCLLFTPKTFRLLRFCLTWKKTILIKVPKNTYRPSIISHHYIIYIFLVYFFIICQISLPFCEAQPNPSNSCLLILNWSVHFS